MYQNDCKGITYICILKDGTSRIFKNVWLRYFNFCQSYSPFIMSLHMQIRNKVHNMYKEHNMRFMLFFDRKNKNIFQVAKKICAVYGKCFVSSTPGDTHRQVQQTKTPIHEEIISFKRYKAISPT